MSNPVATLFRIPELKDKILFTLFIVFVYRLGGDDVGAGEPAVEVDIGAAGGAEGMELLARGLAADGARARGLELDDGLGHPPKRR